MENLTWKSCIIKKQTPKISAKLSGQFPWVMGFTNIDVKEKVNLFNKTIKKIIRNYVPRETIACNKSDPPWINKDIKELIHGKNELASHIIKIKTTYSLFLSPNFFSQS